jgi:ABC-type multidrug transport system ATPase subunit
MKKFEEKKRLDIFKGHNGAGKSTVTFMLCGLYSATSGTVEMLGYDTRTHLNKVRNSIGYCPQINILYDDLTVAQHLNLICSVSNKI